MASTSTTLILLTFSFLIFQCQPFTLTVKREFSGFYYAEVHLGNPPVKANLVIDTGSGPVWVQTTQCVQCFNITYPGFDPKKSSTFRPMPSKHPLCVPIELQPEGAYCEYDIGYAGAQYTRGYYGIDLFTFNTAVAEHQETIEVAFGLGLFNKILDFADHDHHPNIMAGVLGIGRIHPSSFLLQLSAITQMKFSYYLPRRNGDEAALHFGIDAELRHHANVQTIPILGSDNDFYYVNMTGISVAGSVLPIDPALFSYAGMGVAIDSGSLYTMFISPVYKIVKESIIAYFEEELQLHPLVNKSRSQMDLCYDLREVKKAVRGWLSVAFHFDGGVNLQLTESLTFHAFHDLGEYCLMINEGREVGGNILGAYQQMNRRFFYDVGARKLSFAPEDC
ncbi:hypothetical protein ACFX13_034254 [Malus domestica]|nr:aspartic proteinase nepenthesin-1-like [Malus domestica]